MTSTKPYLIRAFYEWIVDNGHTPHIVVNTELSGVEVPVEYVENEQIVLNIAGSAVQGLSLANELIEFRARFGGRVRYIRIPIKAILAIYARENGRGMVFAEEEEEGEAGEEGNLPSLTPVSGDTHTHSKEEGTEKSKKDKKGKKPGDRSHLTIVK